MARASFILYIIVFLLLECDSHMEISFEIADMSDRQTHPGAARWVD